MSSETPAAVTDGTAITQPELAEALDHELDSCWVGGRELASNVFYYLQQKRTHTPADAAPPVAAAPITPDALRAVLYAHGLMEKEVQDVLAELGAAREPLTLDPEEFAALKRTVRILADLTAGNLHAMRAACIEDQQAGSNAAMQWILNSVPDQWDGPPELHWDGKESAQEWFDRTEAAYKDSGEANRA